MKIFLLAFLLFFPLNLDARSESNQTSTQEADDPYFWDFARADKDTILRHNFVLRNDSGRVLTVKDITTSCGCTVSSVEHKTIMPGEAADIEVRFDSRGYSGVVEQYVYVHTDNLDNPLLKFTIRANIE